jgi:large subunit ribosomal protein L14e
MQDLKGRICIKIRGKEKNRPCVIVDTIDKNFVVIDGLVKKRRCNIKHLNILEKKIKLEKYDKEKIIESLIREGIISKEKIEKLKRKEEIIKKRKEKKK